MRRITNAGSAHAAVLSALHGACFDEPWNEQALTDILMMPGTVGLIGDDGLSATPQGFVLFRVAADEAEIISIGVIREARRTGMAGLLLQASIERSLMRSASKMFLEVAEDNPAARAFYEKSGFTIAGRRAGYYVRGSGNIDALIYRFEITGK